LSAGVRQPPDLGVNQSIGVYCDKSLRPPFDPIRSNLAGLLEFLAVGCGLNEMAPSANSSRTSHLSPDGGSLDSRHCPPLGSEWLQVARSHLSPDGGGVTRAAVHRLAADGYRSHVATCRQTVEALLAPPSTAWQRMATGRT
jgi:hypothetical protein